MPARIAMAAATYQRSPIAFTPRSALAPPRHSPE